MQQRYVRSGKNQQMKNAPVEMMGCYAMAVPLSRTVPPELLRQMASLLSPEPGGLASGMLTGFLCRCLA